MATFSERLQAVIGEETTHAWAQAHDLRPQKVWDWVHNDRTPHKAQIALLAVATGIDEDWWLNGDLPPPAQTPKKEHAYTNAPLVRDLSVQEPGCATVPATILTDDQYNDWAEGVSTAGFRPVRYYSQVSISAGHGALNEDHEPDALLFSRRFLHSIGAHPKQLLLVRVRGDSMLPTLQDGWTVMIDAARRRVDSGIYAIQSGGHEMVKRLESRVGGAVRVISDNRHYDEYEVNTGDDGFSVIGKVVWIAGRAQ